MSTDTDALVAFLRDRLDEEERDAVAAPPAPWAANAEHDEILAAMPLPTISTPAAKLAREFVRAKLGDDHPALETVTLLASEAVTNAVVHSDSRDGGRVTLGLADCNSFIHADVVDAGGATAPKVCGDLFAEGGRGMVLIDTLSCTWGVYEDIAGRTLWFQVAYTRGDRAAPFCPRQRESADPMGA